MDVWVSCLSPSQTIATLSLPLSVLEGKTLVNLNTTASSKGGQTPSDDDEDQRVYAALLDKVSPLINQLGIEVFIKLSCRSAKDVAATWCVLY